MKSKESYEPLPFGFSEMSRRHFVGGGLFALLAVGFGFQRIVPLRSKFRLPRLVFLNETEAVILISLLDAMLPSEASRKEKDLKSYLEAIDRYLIGISDEDLEQLKLLLRGIDQAPLLFATQLQRFHQLDREQRIRLLRSWQLSGWAILRLAFDSLKMVVFLAYYRSPQAFASIGYDGPLVPGFKGTKESLERYDHLIAPMGKEPCFT